MCNYCHAYSRALTWRRPKSDWLMLENMHMAQFITSEMTFRHAFFLNPVASHLNSPEPGEIAADYLSQDSAASYSGVVGMACAPESAAACREMAGQGVCSRARQVLRRTDCRAGGRRRRVQDVGQTEIRHRWFGADSNGTEHRVRGLCLAWQVERLGGRKRGARRPQPRGAGSALDFARSEYGRRPLVLGRLSGIRLRRHADAGFPGTDHLWRQRFRAENR